MFTKQQTFDIVSRHLIRQNAKSRDGKGDCLYRDSNGNRCAAGCLIPDDRYSANLDGNTVYASKIEYLFVDLGHDIDILKDLQEIHDSYDVEKWREELRLCAISHNLKFTEDCSSPPCVEVQADEPIIVAAI